MNKGMKLIGMAINSFQKIIDALDKGIILLDREICKNITKIEKLTNDNTVMNQEINRAVKVKTNIANIIGE